MDSEEFKRTDEMGPLENDDTSQPEPKLLTSMSLDELEVFMQESIRKYGGLFNYEATLVLMRVVQEIKGIRK
jgi:hypothetical protein